MNSWPSVLPTEPDLTWYLSDSRLLAWTAARPARLPAFRWTSLNESIVLRVAKWWIQIFFTLLRWGQELPARWRGRRAQWGARGGQTGWREATIDLAGFFRSRLCRHRFLPFFFVLLGSATDKMHYRNSEWICFEIQRKSMHSSTSDKPVSPFFYSCETTSYFL